MTELYKDTSIFQGIVEFETEKSFVRVETNGNFLHIYIDIGDGFLHSGIIEKIKLNEKPEQIWNRYIDSRM